VIVAAVIAASLGLRHRRGRHLARGWLGRAHARGRSGLIDGDPIGSVSVFRTRDGRVTPRSG